MKIASVNWGRFQYALGAFCRRDIAKVQNVQNFMQLGGDLWKLIVATRSKYRKRIAPKFQ